MASPIAISLSSHSLIQNELKTCKSTFKATYCLQNFRFECLRATKSSSQASLHHLNNNLFPTETAHQCRNCFISHEATLLWASSPQEQIPDFQALPTSRLNQLPIRKANSFGETLIIHHPNCSKNRLPIDRTVSFLKNMSTHFSGFLGDLLVFEMASFLKCFLKLHLFLVLLGFSAPFPCFATEETIRNEELPGKISLESVLIAIDDFFNRNPFFVAGVTFVWLVVIPLTQGYLKKYKFISAIDAFRKLRDSPNAQLLDIRDKRSLLYVGSPNLKVFKKRAVQFQFSEGKEEHFVQEVLRSFKDPQNTTLCVLDNFGGNSMQVAELLFKNGFKEAYAIKGGLQGKDGWQEIQESLLPPAVHVFPKKGKSSKQLEVNGVLNKLTDENGQEEPSFPTVHTGGVKVVATEQRKTRVSYPPTNLGSGRPLSPYPNYPDMKPPSSPTPSKPSS
ncbi:rhodanese-like domain-containing protein 4, chloroplastic [Macadamia integrifolia]|uniref:rhodanese-like domain-containing protein 4, chloroplastic n=1 Tax=Macadamia integrifolia TaxID=60698 RepID=UPI001C529B7F|nr:rhodanese-like domain-containing protein 4, chloroplastic [Macadamia integrifolia]